MKSQSGIAVSLGAGMVYLHSSKQKLDHVDNNELVLEYLSTGIMIADILTKLLQGARLRRLQSMLLNAD
eukprot:gene36751-biopygen25007